MENRSFEEFVSDIENLLIDFDEMGFCPTTLCPFPEEYAINWRKNITSAFCALVYFVRKNIS